MLRLVVLLLVLANGLYFAWSHGFLAGYGFAPANQSEPQRLDQQIRPEQMRVTISATASKTPVAVAVMPASLQEATECLQAGIFTPTQTLALTDALATALPAGSWALENALQPARWIVYMGRYASTAAAIKKRGELRGLNVESELVTVAPLAPGLSLAAFATEAEAAAELARMPRRGVKTAGIRQETEELRGQRLKLAVVNAALRSQLDTVKPQLAGKALLACA